MRLRDGRGELSEEGTLRQSSIGVYGPNRNGFTKETKSEATLAFEVQYLYKYTKIES